MAIKKNDPYVDTTNDELLRRRAARLDNELQADPELAEGPSSGGRVALFAIAIIAILGVVFYGLNNPSITPQPESTAQTTTAPSSTAATAPAAVPGQTTGSATSSPASPPPASTPPAASQSGDNSPGGATQMSPSPSTGATTQGSPSSN